jgi:SAM-dependent methyltransferase
MAATWLKNIDPLDTFQIVLVVLLSFAIANYVYFRWILNANRRATLDNIETFANPDGPDGDTVILSNEHVYDEFYAKIYDMLADGELRHKTETNLTVGWAKSFRPEVETIKVLDVGCGTGHQVELFKKEGVGKAVGVDASEAMVAQSRKNYPKNDYRVHDIEQIGNFAASEFNLITLYYFTYYYLRDPEMMFKNAFQWLEPGGCLVIHLVNREKFDPILESASPFVAFSVQKYAKERITRSKVAFDKFDYEADFDIQGQNAEFREEFKFKTGKVRRQVQRMVIPTMEQVVGIAEQNGFTYKQFMDLTAIGYEYQFLFCFVR